MYGRAGASSPDDKLRRYLSKTNETYVNDRLLQMVKMVPSSPTGSAKCSVALKPVFVTLKVIGVYVLIDRRKKPSMVNMAWSGVVFLYLTLNVTLSITQLAFRQSKSGNLLDQIAVLMAAIVACLLFAVLSYKAKDLRQLQSDIDSAFKRVPNHRFPALTAFRRHVIILNVIGWCLILLLWGAMLNILDNQSPEEYYVTTFQLKPPSSYTTAGIYFAVALTWSLRIFFVHGVLIFVPISFMCFSLLLAEAYREHNSTIVEMGNNVSGPTAFDFSRIRRLHEKICALVSCVDVIYGKNVFFWCVLIIMGVCLDLTQLFTDDNLMRDMAKDDLFYFSLRGVYSAIIFIGTCITASRVTEEAHAALPHIHALTLRNSHLTLDAKMEAQLLICRLTSPSIGLTAWNFFTIDRNFILNITAALTTYMVIVIQLNPKAIKAINSLVNQAVNNTNPINATQIPESAAG